MIGVLLAVGEEGVDERGALRRRSIGGEGLELLGCGQEAPDVEVHAARELRVGDRGRQCRAAATEIGGHDAIDRRLPFGPAGRRQRRAIERQRRFPRGRRGGRGRRHARALIDPAPQKGDLIGAERQIVFRHLRLDLAADTMDHEAVAGVSGTHHRPVFAPLEDVPVGRERQPALAFVLAVALEAAFREHRLDLLLEIDARRRR